MNTRRTAIYLTLIAAVGAFVAWGGIRVYYWWRFPIWVEEQSGLVEASFLNGKYEEAVTAAERLAERAPTRLTAIRRGAEAAVRLGEPARALTILDTALKQVTSVNSTVAAVQSEIIECYIFQGAVALQAQRPAAAEDAYRAVLRLDADNMVARERLGQLLTLLGRFEEATPLLFGLIRDGVSREAILSVLGTSDPVFRGSELLEAALKNEPRSPWPHLGLARVALYDGKLDLARRHIESLLKHQPDHAEAYGLLGRLYLREPPRRQMAHLIEWYARLPATAAHNADVWLVRGKLAQQQQDYVGAARCFVESLRINPCQPQPATLLAGCLNAIGQSEHASSLVQQARWMEELDSRCHLLQQSGASFHGVARITELCEKLGRYWEAAAWARLFLNRPAPKIENPSDPEQQHKAREYQLARQQVDAIRRRVESQLSPGLPRVAPPLAIAQQLDAQGWPIPTAPREMPARPATRTAQLERHPRFEEVTTQANIDFQFHNADDPATPGMRLIETTGGGVAVLDFDQDGWPDLYFTDGGPWPAPLQGNPHSDRLYRNLGNGKFADVTEAAGLGDRAFSQGAAAGDLNNDGWPDLLVCNLGKNRLYLNNTDGTFTEISAQAQFNTEYWSTSAAIADLNLDGVNDIYVVNYLLGDQAYQRICGTKDQPRVCSPTLFDSAPDEFFLGRGDGTWSNDTQRANVRADRGNGLGCVVGDLSLQRQMAVFVANDATANFCFVNQAKPGEPPRFKESAVLMGLAFSAEGRSQGCMGIAAGDFDRDAKIDLFVTNFYRESNALYRNLGDGLFDDESAARGIASASENMLGFGTQFIDADLDGLLDLVVANGHIDDVSDEGVPYKMRPQFFRNLGDRFAEWPADEVGAYFTVPRLGRGLARLDWNLDGLQEFVVSHIDAPASLLVNRSENAGHYFAVELSGTESARDAIGALVTVTTASDRSVWQLTAGDGYQASNHRRLVFGLGGEEMVDSIEVHWPSGQKSQYGPFPADVAVRCIEGKGALVLPHEAAQ